MKTAFVFLSTIFISLSAFAFRLSPMVIRFTPEGRGANQVLLLENPGKEKIPVQIEVFSRKHADGSESREKSDRFTVYPEQIALMPGEKRNVRLTWNGPAKIDSEQAFRIVATQLPVNFKEKNAPAKKAQVSLNFMLQYLASAYVTKDDFAAKIQVKKLKVENDGTAVLTLQNEGKAHQVLAQTELRAKDANGSATTLKAREELESLNLLAGETREVRIPRSTLKPGNYTAELSSSEQAE